MAGSDEIFTTSVSGDIVNLAELCNLKTATHAPDLAFKDRFFRQVKRRSTLEAKDQASCDVILVKLKLHQFATIHHRTTERWITISASVAQ